MSRRLVFRGGRGVVGILDTTSIIFQGKWLTTQRVPEMDEHCVYSSAQERLPIRPSAPYAAAAAAAVAHKTISFPVDRDPLGWGRRGCVLRGRILLLAVRYRLFAEAFPVGMPVPLYVLIVLLPSAGILKNGQPVGRSVRRAEDTVIVGIFFLISICVCMCLSVMRTQEAFSYLAVFFVVVGVYIYIYMLSVMRTQQAFS